MEINWFSTREMHDLCATTCVALAQGLVSNSHDLTIISPDLPGSHQTRPWKHISVLNETKIPGRKTKNIAKNILKIINTLPFDSDIAIVDWTLASTLASALQRKKQPLILMDRSPPADVGILGRLQWPGWKRAWHLVRDGVFHSGCVVSLMHAEFVHRKCGVPLNCIHILSAGVDTTLFNIDKQRNTSSDVLNFIYHGQLDKHRGILAMPIFIQKLRQAGRSSALTFVGEGNAFNQLEEMAKGTPWLTVRHSISQKDMPSLLQKQHVGLLPMPEQGVWPLASPLKRSEYLASGLLVLGIDHTGHQLKGVDRSWFHLLRQDSFHEDGIIWALSLDDKALKAGRLAGRSYAEEFLQWDSSVSALEHAIEHAVNSQRSN